MTSIKTPNPDAWIMPDGVDPERMTRADVEEMFRLNGCRFEPGPSPGVDGRLTVADEVHVDDHFTDARRLRTEQAIADRDATLATAEPVDETSSPVSLPTIAAVESLHEPDGRTIDQLRKLLAQAEAGDLRAVMYVGVGLLHKFGHAGEWDVAEFAMGVKLLDHELSKLIEREADDDG